MRQRLLVTLLLPICATAHAAAPSHIGFFGGGYGIAPDYMYTQLNLEDKNGTIIGHLYQPYERVGKFPLRMRFDGPRARLEADLEGHVLVLDLMRTAIGYHGTASIDGGRRKPASFVLRPGSPPAALLASYEGTFDLGGGTLLTLSRNNATSGFWYVELPSGRTGYLFNLSDREFIAGPCFYCVEPIRMRLSFDADGRLHIGKRVVPRAHLSREERVTFTSADGTPLAGTLYLPLGRGSHPAVVLVHGSGAQTRNGFYGTIRFMAEAYARRGIAALAYDKRGTGESKGDWERANLDPLADDAAAALRLLRTREDIDPRRVGFSGGSQAGWIITLATAQVPELRLIQLQSGAASLGVEEQERLRLVLQMRAEGFPQSEIDRALKIRAMMDSYGKAEQGSEDLQAAYKPIEKTYWASQFIGGLPARDATDWPWLRAVFKVDVMPLLERFAGSVQFTFGQHDTPTPVAVAVPRLEAAFKNGATRDWSIEVVPTATHNGYVGRTGRHPEV